MTGSPRTPDRIGGLSRAAVRQHRGMYLGSLLLAAVILGGSLLSAFATVEREQTQLARRIAETHVLETVALRAWVSEQGGVFVPESAEVPPNPHLPAESRTRLTSDGQRLTLLNPAYLTRILGEQTERLSGTRIRLTSPTPLRPENAPDAWEAAGLAELFGGSSGVWEIVRHDSSERFRYLAPLQAEPSCFATCHQASEVQAGVLGAIAVDYDFGPFREAIRRQRRLLGVGHVTLLVVVFGLLTVLSRALRRSLLRLAAAGERIQDLEQLLPICASCKRVRVEGAEPAGRWVQIEDYVHRSVDAASFSHGVCPVCVRQLDDAGSALE